MPLLPKERDIFPDDVFALPADDYLWTVAHVRSRQEKVLARYLTDRKIPFYLPQTTMSKIRGGRTFRSYLPLFPGYVFVRPPAGSKNLVWRSEVAAQVIVVDDQVKLGSELEQIRSLQLAGASFIPRTEFAPGDAVRVSDG